MTTEQRQWALVTFRLQQAEESLAEAKCLQAGGMSSRSVINRAYYAMFYSVLALLVYEPYSSSKHSGVLGYFNQRFIRTGEIEERLGRALNRAFELRQRSDYRELADATKEQVDPLVEEARGFVDTVAKLLSRSNPGAL